MRVLVVCEGIWPPLVLMSGISAIYDLQKHLSNLGFEIHILTTIESHAKPSWRHWFKNEERGAHLRFHHIDLGPVKRLPELNFYLTKSIPPLAVLKLHSKYHYQVVHEYSSSPLLLRRTALYERLVKTHTIHTLCTYSRGFMNSLRFSNASCVDRVISVTRFMEKALLSAGYSGDRVTYLPLGIDVDKFRISPQDIPSTLKRRLTIPDSSPIVLYVGLIDARKGIFTLAEAAPVVLKQYPEVVFVVASYPISGVFYDYIKNRKKLTSLLLENRIEGKFRLLEGLENIALLMSIADIFVLPLTTAHGILGYPVSLLEAMASGKAIVASDVLGVNELISNGRNGLLCRRGDSQDLARAIGALLSERELRKNLGASAKIEVQAYDVGPLARRLGRLYESL